MKLERQSSLLFTPRVVFSLFSSLLLTCASFARADFIDYQYDGGHHQHTPWQTFSFPGGKYSWDGQNEWFELTSSRANRCEHDTDNHYTSGTHAMRGYVQINNGVSDQSVVQIFNAPASGPILMIKAYQGSGGSFKKQGGSVTIATNILNDWVWLEVFHYLGSNKLEVWVNHSLKWSGSGGAGGSFNIKYGCYGTFVNYARVKWGDVIRY